MDYISYKITQSSLRAVRMVCAHTHAQGKRRRRVDHRGEYKRKKIPYIDIPRNI